MRVKNNIRIVTFLIHFYVFNYFISTLLRTQMQKNTVCVLIEPFAYLHVEASVEPRASLKSSGKLLL